MFGLINLLFQPAVKSYLSYLPNCCFLLDNRHPIKDIFLKHGFHPLQTDLFCCLKVRVMDSISNFEEYWDNFLPNQFLQTQFLAFIWWYFQHEVTILLQSFLLKMFPRKIKEILMLIEFSEGAIGFMIDFLIRKELQEFILILFMRSSSEDCT